MRQRTGPLPPVLTTECSEAPTGTRSELRAGGASGDAAEGGGTFGSGQGSVQGSSIASRTGPASKRGGRPRGGMFGSGH